MQFTYVKAGGNDKIAIFPPHTGSGRDSLPCILPSISVYHVLRSLLSMLNIIISAKQCIQYTLLFQFFILACTAEIRFSLGLLIHSN